MDDNRALNIIPKQWIDSLLSMVGEHSSLRRSSSASYCGASGKANVGISNDKAGEKPAHRKTKVS